MELDRSVHSVFLLYRSLVLVVDIVNIEEKYLRMRFLTELKNT